MRRQADAREVFETMQALGEQAGNQRFLAQLAGVKALMGKSDWRGVLLGCKMLYRIADEGGFLKDLEPILRPLFDQALDRFEKSRAAMVRIHNRLAAVSRKMEQSERLARLLHIAV
jgi:hypothetical protein